MNILENLSIEKEKLKNINISIHNTEWKTKLKYQHWGESATTVKYPWGNFN